MKRYTFKQLDAHLDDDTVGDLVSEMNPKFLVKLSSLGFDISRKSKTIVVATDCDLAAIRTLAQSISDVLDDEPSDDAAKLMADNFIESDEDADYHGGYVLMILDAMEAV